MGFLTETVFLGARLVYWLYLVLAILGAGSIVAYWQRELIRKTYYKLRFPERLIIICMIYPNNFIRRFYRLIPDTTDRTFELEGGTYSYNDAAILKNNNFYAYQDKKKEERLIVKIADKEYYLDDLLKIKSRWDRFPEIYFKYGFPFPYDFNESNTETDKQIIKFNASDLERLKKSTILTQIYNSMAENNIIIFILILVGVNVLIGGFLLAKTMGWLK